MKILVVEDNKDILKSISDVIRAMKHEVICSYDAETVKDSLTKGPFDGVILDIMFPPLKGVDDARSDMGYKGGVILYVDYISRGTTCPFVVLTGVDENTTVWKEALKELQSDPRFLQVCRKPFPTVEILKLFASKDNATRREKGE